LSYQNHVKESQDPNYVPDVALEDLMKMKDNLK
jgi:hypothetical protein